MLPHVVRFGNMGCSDQWEISTCSRTRLATSTSLTVLAHRGTSCFAPSCPSTARSAILCLHSGAISGGGGQHLDRVFHATEDPQAVRDEVFALLVDMDCWVDATILEKRKAQPHLREEASLYKMAWYLHFKHLAWTMRSSDRLFVAASSLGTKKARGALHTAVDDVVRQLSPCDSHRVAFWPAESDPCLQVVDYCTWAIQRKWERTDSRSHALIAPKIRSEFDAWERGTTIYY